MASSGLTSQPLSEAEETVLELYDKLQQLELELALFRFHQNGDPGCVTPNVEEAQLHLLESKAALALRNDVLKSVVTIQPTLRAIHNAAHTSPIERSLSFRLQQRDRTSAILASQCLDLQEATDRLADLESLGFKASQRNVLMAAEILRLQNNARDQGPAMNDSVHISFGTRRLENEMRASRQKWRVVKGTTSAIVTESGIDWARDKQLRNMVLDLGN
ncbi:centromere protein H (CENP-H)-domain-containing protein [Lasiosphaeria miniovina]|uniref:Centromere protein H (CENP-H)-domain-containing protein n=1 Tax=Lasiosphaeria miniovina TaxID=1954250 RepID=A0AA40BFL2_9PEZI|nr:centromere protein H (CENP-H)-domain-containing protein [Lasiosphaeria miniovina]KAK0733335.1 centromere protein H (CENP-H)-domain-containing protein [Lasiosphaeria miniovina]